MSSETNQFEIKMGTEATIAGMTTEVIPMSTTSSTTPERFFAYVHPETTGAYHFGIHGYTTTDCRLYADYFSVSERIPASSPAAVTDLAVTPDPDGFLAATVSFKAPGQTIGGDPLSVVEKIEVYRGRTKIAEFSAVAAGETCTFVDDSRNPDMENPIPKAGTYDYYVVTYGQERGFMTSASVFVGPNVPGPVTDVKVVETDTPGNITLSWDAPAVDKDGNTINPAVVSYRVSRILGFSMTGAVTQLVAEGINETSLVLTPCADDQTDELFAVYEVVAYTSAGAADGVQNDPTPVGVSTKAPYFESFAARELSNLSGTRTLVGGRSTSVSLADNSVIAAVDAVDADEGFLYFRTADTADEAAFYSAKIDLAGQTLPYFSFYVYKQPNNGNSIRVMMRRPGDDYTEAYFMAVNDVDGDEGWQPVSFQVPAAFRDAVVQYEIRVVKNTSMNTFIDRVTITDRHDIDLAAYAISVPDEAVAGQEVEVMARVENRGDKAVDAFEVQLCVDGEPVATQPGAAIAPMERREIAFKYKVGALGQDMMAFSAKVVADGDGCQANDETMAATVARGYANVPSPGAFRGEMTANGVLLSWDYPDLSVAEPVHTTEGFESFAHLATDLAPWTLFDGDGLPQGSVDGVPFDEDEVGDDFEAPAMAGWVVDGTDPSAEALGALGHLGSDKFFMWAYADGGANDDWLISPELYGGPQTITLSFRTLNGYDETMEVLASSTDASAESFTPLAEPLTVNNAEWLNLAFKVPDGTRYVAFRYLSDDMYGLFLDDIDYAAAGGELGYGLSGFNLYRGGTLAGFFPVAGDAASSGTLTDEGAQEGVNEYYLTAVYSNGAESMPVGPLNVRFVGIGSVDADSCAEVEYYNLQGIRVARPEGGVFIMRCGGKAVKVVR